MSRKNEKVASIVDSLRGRPWDAHYLGYFECFNQRLFFEAHEVLEELWRAQRGAPNELFYKGLIQLAGAFVHLQKRRCQPAIALFKLARQNLEKYPKLHEGLDLGEVQDLISTWVDWERRRLAGELSFDDASKPESWPKLSLRT